MNEYMRLKTKNIALSQDQFVEPSVKFEKPHPQPLPQEGGEFGEV
jgi:hypothetical protein